MNLDGVNAKSGKWLFRVLAPQTIAYVFADATKPRGSNRINAERFDCVLVSNDPTKYIMGSVPFRLARPQAAKKAAARFANGSVWEVARPVFDAKYKKEFNAASLRLALLLQEPTQLRSIEAIDGNYNTPSMYICPPATLSHIFQSAALSLAGVQRSTGRVSSHVVGFAAKLVKKTGPCSFVARGKHLRKMDVDVMDDSTISDGAGLSKCSIVAWNNAVELFENVGTGKGIIILGCIVSLDAVGAMIMTMPETGGRVLGTGPRAEQLAALDIGERSLNTELPRLDGEARLTCAAAMLAHASILWRSDEDQSGMTLFQANRVVLEASASPATICTRDDGRLYVGRVKLRDNSGVVEVNVLDSTVPALFGCADEIVMDTASMARNLNVVQHRVNVRGIVRRENGANKYLVAMITKWTPVGTHPFWDLAHSTMLGLTTRHGDVVLPFPIAAISKCPFLQMSSETNGKQQVSTRPVLLVVEGTCASKVIEIGANDRATVFIESENVKCLLGRACSGAANLQCCCSAEKRNEYCLDQEIAVVLVSRVFVEDGRMDFTVMHMKKLGGGNEDHAISAMRYEFQSSLNLDIRETQKKVCKCRKLEVGSTKLGAGRPSFDCPLRVRI